MKKNEGKQYCRACGKFIGLMGWARHVEMHKRNYLRLTSKEFVAWWLVDWEDVVQMFNPSAAKPIEERVINEGRPVNLTDFL